MYSQQLNFSNLTPDRLILLCGEFNKNLKQIEKALRIKVLKNGTEFELKGKKEDVGIGVSALFSLKEKLETQLKAAEFRFINEQLYRSDDKRCKKILSGDAAKIYHEGKILKKIVVFELEPAPYKIDLWNHIVSQLNCKVTVCYFEKMDIAKDAGHRWTDFPKAVHEEKKLCK